MITQEVLREFRHIFPGEENIITQKETLRGLSHDLCTANLFQKNRLPHADVAVRPTSLKQMWQCQQLVKLARSCQPKLRISTRGLGSGVCRAFDASDGDIVLDMSMVRGARVIAYPSEEQEGLLYLEAGASGGEIDVALRHDSGRRFSCGHYPASYYVASFAGGVQCGGSGHYAFRYGKMKDLLRRADGVTGNGDYVELSGDDLKRVVGMEGTTLIMTSGILPIFEMPPHDEYLSFAFRDVEDVGVFLQRLSLCRTELEKHGVNLYAVRCYDPFDNAFIGKPRKGDTPMPRRLKRIAYAFEKRLCRHGEFIRMLSGVLERAGRARWIGVAYLGAWDENALLRACRMIESEVKRQNGTMCDPAIARMWQKNRYKLGSENVKARFAAGIVVDTFDYTPSWENFAVAYEAVSDALSQFGAVGTHMCANLDGPYGYATLALPERSETLLHEAWQAGQEACFSRGVKPNDHHGIGQRKDPRANGETWLRMAQEAKQVMNSHGILNPRNLV